MVVTMMPAVASERGAPRTIGVEFPFGHAFGMPGDGAMHHEVLTLALRLLAGASEFGARVDMDIEWPVPLRDAYKAWQPGEPSPIVRKFLETLGQSRA